MKKYARLVLTALSLNAGMMRVSMIFASTDAKAADFELGDPYEKKR